MTGLNVCLVLSAVIFQAIINITLHWRIEKLEREWKNIARAALEGK